MAQHQVETLFEIVGIGTPLTIDEATLSRVFGLYARVLVDVDMSGRLFDYVLVEREVYAFLISIEYEKQPLYCAHCKMLGHTMQNCKKLSSKNDQDSTDKPKVAKKKKLNTMHNDSIVFGGKELRQSQISQRRMLISLLCLFRIQGKSTAMIYLILISL